MKVTITTAADLAADTGTLKPSATLHQRAVHALRNVMDPELPLNIYDLGLVYGLDLHDATQTATLTMTLTAPNCPVAAELPEQARLAVQQATGYTTTVTLTFTPPWDKSTLSLDAKLALGLL
jgi:metal-sulfur cluster biosynthetic enzyme